MRRAEIIRYRWFHGEDTITRIREVVWCPKKTLRMVDVQSEHSGVYTVEAILSNGRVLKSRPAYIIIRRTSIHG